MNVAIVHYHLNPGGVTQVIVNQLKALERKLEEDQQRLSVAVFFDGQDAGWPKSLSGQTGRLNVTLCPVPELAYDQETTQARPLVLVEQLRRKLKELAFSPNETILHVHNHSLGKNASLPEALVELAKDGFRLLLQVHDFAEDFRPANYRHLVEALGVERLKALYPDAAHVHYATLNTRDQQILQAVGLSHSVVHWLPNPIAPPPQLPAAEEARQHVQKALGLSPSERYLLYPVRGIRRKNLGEALLLAALNLQKHVRFALTLPPLNPREIPRYQHWKELSDELNLPFLFEVGTVPALTFGINMAAADAVLTTSVAEGFGMVFLESALLKKTLLGRNLPEITQDFETHFGMDFQLLYEQLFVPVEWLGGKATVVEGWYKAYSQTLEAFGVKQPSLEEFQRQAQVKFFEDSWVDFADLDEQSQEQIIRRVAKDPQATNKLLEQNHKITSLTHSDQQVFSEVTTRNTEAALRYSNESGSGARLLQIYRQLLTAQPTDVQPTEAVQELVQRFLSFQRFRPIRG